MKASLLSSLLLFHLTIYLTQADEINFGDDGDSSGSDSGPPTPLGEAKDPIPAEPSDKPADVNSKFFNQNNLGNQNGCAFGRRKRRGRRQINTPDGSSEAAAATPQEGGEETNTKFFNGGLGGVLNSNPCYNPCGRRRRQAEGEDKTNTKFFGNQGCNGFNNGGFNNGGFSNGGLNNGGFSNGGFNNGGFSNGGLNNGGFNNGGFNNGGLANGGFNNGGFNNGGLNNGGFNNGGFNNGGINNGGFNSGGGSCTTLSFVYNGQQQGACQTPDNTGQVWCYTNGFNNGCYDLQQSARFPSNPWSYAACRNQC